MPGRRHTARSGRQRSSATALALVLLLVIGLVVAALTASSPAGADEPCTATWTGGAGTWDDAAHWTPAGVPDAQDDVCIGPADGPAATVRVRASVDVASLTLTAASLALAPATTVTATQFDADRAGLSGGGTLAGNGGITRLTDTRLAGVRVTTSSRLQLGGRITVSGGTTVEQPGTNGGVDLLPGVQVVDADGNAGNHLQFARFPLYLTGTVFVGVRLTLVDLVLLAQGDVTLAALDNLDADGWLRTAPGGRSLQLGASSTGTLHLPRSVTRIGRGVDVYSGRIETGSGTDALSALQTVDGSLSRTEPLWLVGPLTVTGRLASSSSVGTQGVMVRAGASFTAARVDGELRSAGSCVLSGARIGQLVLQAGSDTVVDLTAPVTVFGRAVLAGSLTVQLGGRRLPATGTAIVLLTATRGVTGTFATVTSDQPNRAQLRAGYRPTWVTGTLTAPT